MQSISVLFVLPSSGGGGGPNSVVQEIMGLNRVQVDAQLAVNSANHAKLVAGYPELAAMNVPVHSYESANELADVMVNCNIAVATTNASVFVIDQAAAVLNKRGQTQPRYAYYVQDYEPLFYPPDSDEWSRAYRSYSLLKDVACFAKTRWLCDVVYANHGIQVAKVRPSIDHDIYFPIDRPADASPTIMAMIRPSTARRAPRRTVHVLNEVRKRYPNASAAVFGCDAEELASYGLDLDPGIRNWGVMKRHEVPDALRHADVFLDLSDYQAFGRTGLEGMACGCVPVVPVFGGSSEYAVHGHNAFVVDTRHVDLILDAVDTFMAMGDKARQLMRLNALETAAEFNIARAALSELRLFYKLMRIG